MGMRSIFFRLFVVIIVVCCCSWGFLVHRTVNQLAIYKLPKPMRSFFYTERDYLANNAPRPDQRRRDDSTEASKHFIDLELYGDSAAFNMPIHWDDALRKYGKDSLLKYGYVPYHIITMKDKLEAAFRAGNRDSILFYATDLGHYIGDANVPLHTTENYDGQLTGQKGLHSLWESFIPELELDQYTLQTSRKAQYISNPEERIWQTIRRSYALVPMVLNEEKEASKQFTDSTKFMTRKGREGKSYTPAFATAYSLRMGKMVNEQLLNSAQDIADFWYTAWVDAGKPSLAPLVTKPVNKKAMKKEYKAYRKGQLIEKKLLLSKQQQTSDR
jgi:hypothetical protein